MSRTPGVALHMRSHVNVTTSLQSACYEDVWCYVTGFRKRNAAFVEPWWGVTLPLRATTELFASVEIRMKIEMYTAVIFLAFMGPCLVIYFCNKTKKMHNLSSLLNITLHYFFNL